MNKTTLVPYVLEKYHQGQRYFQDLDLENESFEGQNLEDITFEGCSLYISFRKANLKNANVERSKDMKTKKPIHNPAIAPPIGVLIVA